MYVTIVSIINFYIVVLGTAAVRGCPGRYDFHMIKVAIRERPNIYLQPGYMN
jgi:uncharacterized membrane protein